MSLPKLYFNPRCSKAREARRLLDDRAVAYDVVAYLDAPPSRAELEGIVGKLDGEPADLVRRNDPRFADLGLDKSGYRTAAEVVDLLVAHPELLERPILVTGAGAVIGRPPERILDLLS